jgi:hypothetical protein
MMKLSVSWIVSLSVRVYQWLLYIGPAEFRSEYGQSMIQVFRQCCRDAYQHQGARGVLRLWLPVFSDQLIGLLAERLSMLVHKRNRHSLHLVLDISMNERMKEMLRTLRRSMIIIFCAFVLFGLAWLFFFRMDDPLSWWLPIVRLHPEIDITFQVILIAGFAAFLLLLAGGLPIIFSAVKQALATRRRDILVLFGISAFMVILFAVVIALVQLGLWGFDPNGGIFALIFLAVLLVVTVSVGRAVVCSETSERVLRFALFPMAGVTIAMGVGLLATFVEAWFLYMYTPQAFSGSDTANWVIADAMMVIALCMAVFALWRGMRTRNLMAA